MRIITGKSLTRSERLVAVFMTQLLPAGGLDLQAKFKTLVYQSIIESREKK
jgi:hypothetical protein